MKRRILKEGKKYTFSDYFDLNYPTEEIVQELGYAFALEIINFSLAPNYDLDIIEKLSSTYYKILPQISLNSEIAKREFLIAPILIELVKITDIKLNLEYPLEVNEKLNGNLDYLISSEQDLIVIEAKKGDLDRGFNQLAAEMIALDQSEERDLSVLYGAITVGEIWKFAILKRSEKLLTKDIHSYRIPEDLKSLFSILLGIFTNLTQE